MKTKLLVDAAIAALSVGAGAAQAQPHGTHERHTVQYVCA